MIPSLSNENAVNGHPVDRKMACYFGASDAAFKKLANLAYFLIGKFRMNIIGTDSNPSLPAGVGHVIGMSSDEEMIRINATWIVPVWTVVAHLKSFWNWTVNQSPRCSMSQFITSGGRVKQTVARDIQSALPNPAITNNGEAPEKLCSFVFSAELRAKFILVAFFVFHSLAAGAAMNYRKLRSNLFQKVTLAGPRTVMLVGTSYARRFALEVTAAGVTFNQHLKTFLLGVTRPGATTAGFTFQFISASTRIQAWTS